MAEQDWGLLDPQSLASLQEIQRRKALAQALLESSQENIDPARSSGRYVIPVSPFEGLAKIGKAYFGAKGVQQADKDMLPLIEALRGKQQAAKDADRVRLMRSTSEYDEYGTGGPEPIVTKRDYRTKAGSDSTPVTPVTIQDPNDPSKTIVVDGRTGRKIGAGPKLTQTGTVDQKLALGKPQATLRLGAVSQNLDRLGTAIDELKNDPGLAHITGTIAGRTPNLTNLATGAQAKLNSIKSQIFVEALQAMREASKTGGAVGNVSDREGDKLENTLAALDQAQGTPDFIEQLGKAREQLRLSKARLQQAYDEQYGGIQQDVPAAAPAGGFDADKERRYQDWKARQVPK